MSLAWWKRKEHSAAPLETNDGPPVVLIVDDEEPVRKSLSRLLAFEEYHIIEAEDGHSALDILRSISVDVIITDYHMAGMNGVELLREVIPLDPTISRILFSGHIDVELIREAVNDGDVNHFITKPWDDDEILLAVRQCTERTQWLRKQKAKESENRRRTEVLEMSNSSLSSKVRDSNHALQLSQDILDTLPVIVIGISNDGEIAMANSIARHCFPECVPGDPIDSCVPDSLGAWALRQLEECSQGIHVDIATGTWRFEALPLDKRGLILTGHPLAEVEHVD